MTMILIAAIWTNWKKCPTWIYENLESQISIFFHLKAQSVQGSYALEAF